ncbi:mitochondrial 37S ribosomal protein bS1m, partial [Calcarisporiella thermophila]|uniref:mitochondrial 37S ribosomal protein bS1m n=1 Tax=Calcarisporiella thermophila TaxID=911321 RepID=UPI0037436B98
MAEKSFASLFRYSKLASYDPSLPQVYHTYGALHRIGDWGLKRNLPTVVRTKYATIQALDTQEHQTPYRSAQDSVLFLQRWRENFGPAGGAIPNLKRTDRDIASMSEKQWKRLLGKARKRRDEWKKSVKNGDISGDAWLQFMGLTRGTHKSQIARPIYAPGLSGRGRQVEGRVLNRYEGGFAVGVCGVVAYLPYRYGMGLWNPNQRYRRTFDVVQAGFDDQGRPSVTLNLPSQNDIDEEEYIPALSSSTASSASSQTSVTKRESTSRYFDASQLKNAATSSDLESKVLNLLSASGKEEATAQSGRFFGGNKRSKKISDAASELPLDILDPSSAKKKSVTLTFDSNFRMSKFPAALNATEEDIQQMLAAQTHIGTKNCNIRMQPYVYKRRAD